MKKIRKMKALTSVVTENSDFSQTKLNVTLIMRTPNLKKAPPGKACVMSHVPSSGTIVRVTAYFYAVRICIDVRSYYIISYVQYTSILY